jgi:hypothetical protein
MNYLTAIRKRWATGTYARRLPGLLLRDYGFSSFYTPMQIRRTIERYRLNSDYSCYAISMFSDRTGFDQYHLSIGENCDYDTMRSEIATTLFHGNLNFTVSEIMEAHAGAGHHAGDGHSGADGHSGVGHW